MDKDTQKYKEATELLYDALRDNEVEDNDIEGVMAVGSAVCELVDMFNGDTEFVRKVLESVNVGDYEYPDDFEDKEMLEAYADGLIDDAIRTIIYSAFMEALGREEPSPYL